MSIVAYRDGVIASDGRMTSGSAIISENIRKIAKGPGVVGGFVGGSEELGEYLRWVSDGANLNNIPDGSGTGFVVFDRRKNNKSLDFKAVELIIVDKTKWVSVPLETFDYYADGTGFKVAFGAFYMGNNAVDAVHAAIAHDNNCGGTIRSENLFE